jgi:histidyl-tRNA synthetase
MNTNAGKAPIGGGGRYDGLVKSLGGVKDMPALGFAFNIEQIIDALNDESKSSNLTAEKG